jgi:hypothetical protein
MQLNKTAKRRANLNVYVIHHSNIEGGRFQQIPAVHAPFGTPIMGQTDGVFNS